MDAVLKPTTQQSGQWTQRGSHVALAGQGLIDGVDAVARAMETKWGVDRLRLLVSDDLRAKFDRQRVKLNIAIWHGDLADLERECPRSITAWRALDAAATAAGQPVLSPEAWETALSDGTVVTIVRSRAEQYAVSDGRRRQVWTLDEVARCIEQFPAVVKAKQTFPGATVQISRDPPDPLMEMSTAEFINDELPF